MTDQGSFANIGLRWVVDQGSLSQVKQSLDSVRKNLTDLGGEAAKDSASVKRLSEEAQAIGRDSKIANVAKDFVNLGAAIKDNNAALKTMQATLQDIGTSSADIDKATASFKALAAAQSDAGSGGGSGFSLSGLRRTGSAVEQLLPGSGIGTAISKVGDFGEIAKKIGEIKEALAGVGNEAAPLTSLFLEMGGSAGVLGAALGPVALGLGAVALAVKAFSDELDKGHDAVKQAITELDKYYELLSQGSSELIKKQIEDAKKSVAIKEAELKTVNDAELGAMADTMKRTGYTQKTLEDTDPAFADTAAQIKKLNNDIAELNRTIDAGNRVLPVVVDLEREHALQLQRQGEYTADATAATYEYSVATKQYAIDAKKAAAETARAWTAAIAKTQAASEKQNTDLVAIGEKYDAADKANTEKAEADKLAIQQKGIEQAKAITQKGIDDANAALAALFDKQNALILNASRENEKDTRKEQLADTELQIKYYQQSRDDLEAHLQKIRDIENSFKSEERDDLLDRNYRGIFQLRERKNDERTAEDQSFADKKQQRTEAEQDERGALQRQRQFEANERRIALQNSLNDAKAGYEKELALQAAAQKQAQERLIAQTADEINLVNQKAIAQHDILLKARNDQVAIILQTENEKTQIFNAQLANMYRVAASIGALADASSGGAVNTGQPIQRFAAGGSAMAGQPYLVNDDRKNRTESFNGVRFPPGLGLFIPAQSGNVSPGSGSGGGDIHLTQSFYVSGAGDPELTARKVLELSKQGARQVLKEYLA